jgi:hypothetical protein
VYAYALGIYLGDGCLAPVGGSYSLRVVLDVAYSAVIEECATAIRWLRG